MNILFVNYARGDWGEVRINNRHQWQYQSDNGKLTWCSSIWDNVWKSSRFVVNTSFSIITHSLSYFSRKIDSAEYLFTDILQKGILSFDYLHFKLQVPKLLNPTKHKVVEDLEYWFIRSKKFYKN